MKATQPVEQRARDAIAQLLVRMLQVPTVYFDAPWNSRNRTNILAIDRAGSGDVHVVEVKQDLQDALDAAAGLMKVPAQFRWVAFFNRSPEKVDSLAKKAGRAPLFSPKGMGRIGVIEVHEDEDPFGEKLEASILVRGERFAGSLHDIARKFVDSHRADISFE